MTEEIHPGITISDNPTGAVQSQETREAIDLIKNSPPRHESDLFGEGLSRGFTQHHLTKADRINLRTIGRYVCDVAILVIRHPNGTSDVVLSHFLPDDLSRQAHAELFAELDISSGPDDTTEALILTSTVQGEDRKLQNIIDAITGKNNNQPPYVVRIAAEQAFKHESEIRFKQIPRKDGYTQEIKIKKPKYRKITCYQSSIETRTRHLAPPRTISQ